MSKNFIAYEKIVFDEKPEAVPYNYRISYKVAQICLIMYICGYNMSCSLLKLHLLSSALMSKEKINRVINFCTGLEEDLVVRFEPAVNRALSYAVAYKYVVQMDNGKYKLTDIGRCWAKHINDDGNLMVSEISDLRSIAKKLTESRIQELVKRWRDRYVENK